jgi:hypothetical protein
MKVYLAASYSRKDEISKLREELRSMGLIVNSRWLDQRELPLEGKEKYLRENAFIDVEDVLSSNVLVRFTDDLGFPLVPSSLATGSRFFETGLAWARGIPIVVVGGNQCIFDRLPNIIHLKDTNQLKRYLAPYEIN